MNWIRTCKFPERYNIYRKSDLIASYKLVRGKLTVNYVGQDYPLIYSCYYPDKRNVMAGRRNFKTVQLEIEFFIYLFLFKKWFNNLF